MDNLYDGVTYYAQWQSTKPTKSYSFSVTASSPYGENDMSAQSATQTITETGTYKYTISYSYDCAVIDKDNYISVVLANVKTINLGYEGLSGTGSNTVTGTIYLRAGTQLYLYVHTGKYGSCIAGASLIPTN